MLNIFHVLFCLPLWLLLYVSHLMVTRAHFTDEIGVSKGGLVTKPFGQKVAELKLEPRSDF